jgi:hypothetical protein
MTNSTGGIGSETDKALLEAIGTPLDLTLCFGPGGADALRALVSAEQLLGDRRTRTVWLDELAALRGDTLVLCAPGGFTGPEPWGPVALSVADLRFERVVVLPTTFDSEIESVRDALAATRAIVFARDETALTQIGWLCDARLAPGPWSAGPGAATGGITDANAIGSEPTRPSVLLETFARVQALEEGAAPPELVRDANAVNLLRELLAARGPAWLATEWAGGRLTPLLGAPGVLAGSPASEAPRPIVGTAPQAPASQPEAPPVEASQPEAPRPIPVPDALRAQAAPAPPHAPLGTGAPAPLPRTEPAEPAPLPPSEPVAAPEAPISPPSEPEDAVGSGDDGDLGSREEARAGTAGHDRASAAREPLLARAGQAFLVGAAAAIKRFIGPGE